MPINREALETVESDLAEGNPLTFAHCGAVFGDEFWIMVVYSLMDAQDAARAIQGAINRITRQRIAEAEAQDAGATEEV